MYLIIGNEKKIKLKTSQEVHFLNDICDLKNIELIEEIYLIDCLIDDEGIINDSFYFEEIIITVNVKRIITNHYNQKLSEICSYHNVDLVVIE